MDPIVVVMLALLAPAAVTALRPVLRSLWNRAATLLVRAVSAMATSGGLLAEVGRGRRAMRTPRHWALLLRPGDRAVSLVPLRFGVDDDDDGEFDLRGTLEGAGVPSDPLPVLLVPQDSPLGRRMAGLPQEGQGEQPKSWLMWVKEVGPYVVAGAALLLAVWVIARPAFSAEDKKAAWAVLASVLSFWLGKAT